MAAREALQGIGSQSPPEQSDILVDGTVFIKHPSVGSSLFVFPAYSQPDPADPSRPLFGVCYILALDACRVLTNHAAGDREDFLALDREGKAPVPLPTDDDGVALLAAGDYYYFLGPPEEAANYNYPIVKEFSTFRFPTRLPNHWYRARPSARLEHRMMTLVPSLHMSAYVTSRDESCGLTGYQGFNRCAYLVPEAEAAWFAANEMSAYSIENHHAGVRTHTNGIALRADVHCCLEAHDFVLYPAPGGDGGFMAYFVHCGGYPDYTELLHRRRADINPSVAVEFLYARFAYTVVNLWRPEVLFDSVPANDKVKVIADAMALEKAKHDEIGDGPAGTSEASESEDSRSHVSRGDDGESDMEPSPDASNEPSQPLPDESYADGGDERWKERLFRRIPGMAALEEVENPPDVVDCHPETPRMMRLTSRYMKEHPQVWQTSTMPEGMTRDDVEGWYAKWMTRPV